MSMTANRNSSNNAVTEYQERDLELLTTKRKSIINQQKEDDQNHNHPDNENNKDYYYNTHGAGRFMTPEDCERIKEAYLDNVSDRLTSAVAKMIEDAFKAGLTVDEIIMAIEETGFAPNPAPPYLRRILERWALFGVTVSRIRHERTENAAHPWWR